MKMCLPALKKCLPAFIGLSLLATAAVSHAAPKVGVSVANYMITTWPNLDDTTCGVNCFNLTYSTVPATGVPKYWEYTNGVPLMGLWKIYEKTGNVAYYNYVKKFVDSKIDANGNIDYTFGGTAVRDPHIQDTMQPGMLLPALYKKTKDARYLKAMVNLRAVFNTMSVNPEGAWWHKPTYPNQQWLDSTYMSLPFLSMYAKDYAEKQLKGDAAVSFNLITQQLKLMSDNTLNPVKGLYYHAWNDSADGVWQGLKTPPAIGAITSPVLWSRSIAWLYVGVIDVLENLPDSHPDRDKLRKIVKNISVALEKYQDPKTGLWNQVIDVTNDKLPANGGYANESIAALPNWNETSASALFVYGLSKAERADILAPHYRDIALKGWEGVKKQVEIAGASVKVHGTVVGMSVGGTYNSYVNADFRTDLTTGPLPAPAGCTQVAYVTPPANCKYLYVRDNVPQGIGAVLLAASEME
ncbi:glycoside hydrolase family 88 protein [Uliginosibacterium sp. H3]|uniref:Glycoside hydrolase family 88 protein n=1 Tax=Uliginosibacterium silvisoli TaxID=3114758 RepID=A0ABU6K0K0_9RHOO|nr:glycoside hydrolase family 88 protein [Uliginosibacterium sp. H3]